MIFKNKKKIKDGYHTVIEPNFEKSELNTGEDYEFLNLINQNENNNDNLEEKENQDNLKINKDNELINYSFYIYILFYIITIKLGSLINEFQEKIINHYNQAGLFKSINIPLAFLLILLFSFLLIIIYRLFQYHFSSKTDHFFSLNIINKLIIFTAINSFLFLNLYVLNIYFLNISNQSNNKYIINTFITLLFKDFFIILLFSIGLFTLFSFFYSLFPKRFRKTRITIMFLSLVFILIMNVIMTTGISMVLNYIPSSVNLKDNSQIPTISTEITHFYTINNYLLYTFRNGTEETGELVKINSEYPYKKVFQYSKICKIYPLKDYFLINYNNYKNKESGCNHIAIYDLDGNKRFDLELKKISNLNYSIEGLKTENIYLVNIKNKVMIYSINKSAVINIGNISLKEGQRIVDFDKQHNLTILKSNRNSNMKYELKNIYTNKSITLPSNIISIDFEKNKYNQKNNEISLIAVIKTLFMNHYPYEIKINLINKQIIKKLIMRYNVYKVIYDYNNTLFLTDDGNVILFEGNKQINKIMKYPYFLINPFEFNNNRIIWERPLGLKIIYPHYQLFEVTFKSKIKKAK